MNAAILVAVFTVLALMIAPGAFAHESEEHGILTVHDEEGGPPTHEVHCEFWVEGRGLDHPEGNLTLGVFLGGPSASTPVIDNWTGVENLNGTYDFNGGPYIIDRGQDIFDLFAWAAMGEEDNHTTPWVGMFYRECPPPPTCSPDISLSAIAHEDESVTVEAHDLDREAGLERAVAGTDDFEHVATLDEGNTTFRDTGTEAETTYEYRLVANGETCATVEVTAIPVFPGLIVASLATVAGLGAYGAIARHRKD